MARSSAGPVRPQAVAEMCGSLAGDQPGTVYSSRSAAAVQILALHALSARIVTRSPSLRPEQVGYKDAGHSRLPAVEDGCIMLGIWLA
jgi:hypothetical protein